MATRSYELQATWYSDIRNMTHSVRRYWGRVVLTYSVILLLVAAAAGLEFVSGPIALVAAVFATLAAVSILPIRDWLRPPSRDYLEAARVIIEDLEQRGDITAGTARDMRDAAQRRLSAFTSSGAIGDANQALHATADSLANIYVEGRS